MQELIEASAESIISGQSTAPAVRVQGKRKAYDEGYKRVPVAFSAPVSRLPGTQPSMSTLGTSAESTSNTSNTTVQTTLSSSWGDSRILTAVRQALIDHLLLRFIVCCSISFAILDNGFFFDFVTAL